MGVSLGAPGVVNQENTLITHHATFRMPAHKVDVNKLHM